MASSLAQAAAGEVLEPTSAAVQRLPLTGVNLSRRLQVQVSWVPTAAGFRGGHARPGAWTGTRQFFFFFSREKELGHFFFIASKRSAVSIWIDLLERRRNSSQCFGRALQNVIKNCLLFSSALFSSGLNPFSSLSHFVSGFPTAWIAVQQVILNEVSLTRVKKLILIADILRSKRR